MIVTYEDVTPTLIANTVMRKRFFDGAFAVYTITPVDGYVLHDKLYDLYEEFDEAGNPIGEPLECGCTRGTCTCRHDYDFIANPREFCAIPEGVDVTEFCKGKPSEDDVDSETLEKAEAYDILMGVSE